MFGLNVFERGPRVWGWARICAEFGRRYGGYVGFALNPIRGSSCSYTHKILYALPTYPPYRDPKYDVIGYLSPKAPFYRPNVPDVPAQ
jgi:hypothetical protein